MEEATGMGAVITSLTTSISGANLWAEVGNAVPLIAVAVLFALGYRVVRKATKGVSKAKANM